MFMYVCILYVCKCTMYINGSRVMMVKNRKISKTGICHPRFSIRI